MLKLNNRIKLRNLSTIPSKDAPKQLTNKEVTQNTPIFSGLFGFFNRLGSFLMGLGCGYTLAYFPVLDSLESSNTSYSAQIKNIQDRLQRIESSK